MSARAPGAHTLSPSLGLTDLVQATPENVAIVKFIDLNDSDRQAVCDAVEKLFNSMTTRFAVLMDMRALQDFPPPQRKMYATTRENVREVYAKHHALTVYLLRDPAQRGLLTAIGWLSKASNGSGRTFVYDYDAALAACRLALAAPARNI